MALRRAESDESSPPPSSGLPPSSPARGILIGLVASVALLWLPLLVTIARLSR